MPFKRNTSKTIDKIKQGDDVKWMHTHIRKVLKIYDFITCLVSIAQCSLFKGNDLLINFDKCKNIKYMSLILNKCKFIKYMSHLLHTKSPSDKESIECLVFKKVTKKKLFYKLIVVCLISSSLLFLWNGT